MITRMLLVLLLATVTGWLTAVDENSSESDPHTPWFVQARAAGMPDVRGATCYRGIWKVEPTGHWRQGRYFGFQHLHLRLADGRWLMRGIYLRPAAAPEVMLHPRHVVVDTTTEVSAADILFRCDYYFTPTVLLALAAQAGVRQAGVDGQPVAVRRQQLGWDDLSVLLLPYHEVTWIQDESVDDRKIRHGTSDTRARDARRGVHVLLMLMAQQAREPSDITSLTTAALALLDESEHTVRGNAVARLADLAEALPTDTTAYLVRNWDGYLQEVRRGGENKQYDQDMCPVPWKAEHLDDLVALVGDERPSRWFDRGIPRSLGDNALRALAWYWGVDPRRLIGRDPSVTWSAAERAATATALQAWWRTARERPWVEVISDDPALRALWWTSKAAKALAPGERPAAAQAVVAAWRELDQAGRDALPVNGVEEVLGILGDEPQLKTLMLSWPLTGPLRRTLSLWRELHGDPAPLTAHLREVLAGTAQESLDFQVVKHVTAKGPEQDRLDLLLTALRTDTTSGTFNLAYNVAVYFGSFADTTPLFAHRFSGFYGRSAMPLALTYTLLWDRRPIPEAWLQMLAWRHKGHATDLRVCDLVVLARADEEFHDVLQSAKDQSTAFDLSQPLASRDTVIARCRAALLPLLTAKLAASGLRLPDPAGGGDLAAALPAWWQSELDTARAAGKAVALLVTDTKHCAPCVRLEHEVLAKPEWQAWAHAHLHVVVFDSAKHPDDKAYWQRASEIHRIYDGAGIPNLFVIDSDGRLLAPRMSFEPHLGPRGYISEFERILSRRR